MCFLKKVSCHFFSQTQRRSRSLSPASTPRHNPTRRSRSLERPLEESFFDDDDDDDWIFDPMIDEILDEFRKRQYDEAFSDDEDDDMQYCGAVQPMLDFELRPVGTRRNWKHVLNKQRCEATLTQHRDATPSDNLGEELTQTLRRTIERQIEADRSLTPNSTVHFTLQSRARHSCFPIHHLHCTRI